MKAKRSLFLAREWKEKTERRNRIGKEKNGFFHGRYHVPSRIRIMVIHIA